MLKVQKKYWLVDIKILGTWNHSYKFCLQSFIFFVFIILYLIGKWITKHLPNYAW